MIGNIKKIHFIGIGGIGMSGLAEILLAQGYKISGSDKSSSSITDRLVSLGAEFYVGHSENNINNVDLIVYSSAVPEDNPELKYGNANGIISIKRSEMLAECTRWQYSICVAGTHGKTSTTSMISLILLEAGFDPTLIIGGTLKQLNGSNARFGSGKYVVAEADEYDRTFLKLNPTIAVITNIDLEHLDIYSDLEDIKNSFFEFASKVPFYGFIVACIDEANVKDVISNVNKEIITYGIDKTAVIRAEKIEYSNLNSSFQLFIDNKYKGNVNLSVPGLHNVRNCLAAIAVASKLGIPLEVINNALFNFRGADRRFEVIYDSEILIIDDYAHHPNEVDATLNAISKGYNRRIVAVFQPHLFTRTRDFYKDFGKVFQLADVFVCLEIYPSRENPIEGITSQLIIDEAKRIGHQNAIYIKDSNELIDKLFTVKENNDVFVFLGAGSITSYSRKFASMVNSQ